MKTMKKLVAATLIGLLFALSANAQTAPTATVDPNTGDLILGDGSTVPVPPGTVDGNGALDLGDGTIIPAPEATVNPNGSLTVDETTYQIPALPQGGDFIVSWFGDDMYKWEQSPVTVDQYYWNFKFKFINHQASGNWFWSDEFSAWMFVSPDGSSVDTGFWAYFVGLFDGTAINHASVPAQTNGLWAYLWTGPQADFFNDLRDQDLNGTYEIDAGNTGNYVMDGFLWLLNDANGYDSAGGGLFWFSEYESKYGNNDPADDQGNFITRMTEGNAAPSDAYWMKLTPPI